jgi:UDP-N-acetylglucosamine--dolichyl-phosphate N-acetylglucosaminephosphotransferase
MLFELFFIISLVISFFFSYISTKILIKWHQKTGFLVKDMHKPKLFLVPKTGGPAILTGFLLGVSFLIAATIIFHENVNFLFILSAIICIITLSYLGLVDDFFEIPSYWKFFLPSLATIPLIAALIINEQSTINLPFIGNYDFGYLYPLLLVPLGVTVASNFTNMLAGFNGIETGMGMIIFIFLSLLSIYLKNYEVALISFPFLGSLAGFFLFNKYPSKIFPGDSGTYMIGGALAAAVIIGNVEWFGFIAMIPYLIDGIIKAANNFPKSFAFYKEGKLYPPKEKIRGFVDLVLHIFNGMKEKDVVLFFIFLELIFSFFAFSFYLKPKNL